MILLIGNSEDNTIIHFSKYLIDKKLGFLFLNQKLLDDYELGEKTVSFHNRHFDYNSFTGVLNRISSPNESDSIHTRKINHLIYLLNNVLANVVNPISSNVTNYSKLHQLSLVKNVLKEIYLPESIIIAKSSFDYISRGRYIYKSLSSIRSIVKEYKHTNEDLLYDEPVLFQRLIPGTNIRVHVIGDKIFPVKIQADAIDYRYAKNRDFSLCTLPESIAEDCFRIADALSLKFAGIDLMVVKDQYFILEINPSPGYSFYELHLSINGMSNALSDLLINSK